MQKVRVNAFSLSLDGFAAGPRQSLQDPLGAGGMALHQWVFPTRSFQQMHQPGRTGGSTGIDDDFAARAMQDIGAWILGRNMFGPVRGPWPDAQWRGWWGDEPPYHVPVFVLTHHAREPLEMAGGTTFHFITDGIEAALDKARRAAGERDVRIGGGAATVRQYLRAQLIDEMHLAMAPVLLGAGENLFADIDLPALGYTVKEHVATEAATHITIGRD